MGYVSYRLFDRVDDAMQQRAAAFRITSGRPSFPRIRLTYDPRIMFLVRSGNGMITPLFPLQDDTLQDVVEVAARAFTSEPESLTQDDHIYRVMAVPYLYAEDKLIIGEKTVDVREIILVSMVDSEVALLDNLLQIFGAGLVIGTTVIFLAGYFLARRALVPITDSWNKQQQFVADASHELRSPLTVVQSNAELILRHPAHTVEAESSRVSNILRETLRMKRLIASLLTLARSDAGELELNQSVFNMKDIVDELAEQFEVLAGLNQLEFRVEAEDRMELTADRERMHQLLVILLDNAVKFTPPQGVIHLTCFVKAGLLHMIVEDSGCGIPAADISRIFDRFFRSDRARSRDKGGTGLGLAIAKWIIDKHGGKVKVESAPGKGSRFAVSLPVKR